MIEIIPNWHPLFVHFSIAFFSLSVIFFVIQRPLSGTDMGDNFMVFARYSLWLGVLLSIGTLVAGWDAYNTVDHDTPSHNAMTEHRNWGLVTFAVFVIAAIWWKVVNRISEKASLAFLLCLFVGAGLLTTTGYKGSQLVYQFGLGVKSLPEKNDHKAGDDHDHAHGDVSGSDHHASDMDSSKDHSHDTMPVSNELKMDNQKMEPEVSSLSKVDSETRVVDKPEVESAPKMVSKPKVESVPKVVSKPKVENTPKVVSKPKVENTPKVVSKPKVENTSKVVSKLKVENTSKVVSKPKVENIPKVVSKPKVKKIPTVISKPKVVVSEAEAASEVMPIEENTFLIPSDEGNTFLIPEVE